MVERATFEERRAPQHGSIPSNSSRRQFVEVNVPQDPLNASGWKFCDTSNWNCTTVLSLGVAVFHIGGSAYIALNSNNKVLISFAVTAITFNILLCYGIIWSRKETLITWLAFYGILSFIAMSCFSPELKVK